MRIIELTQGYVTEVDDEDYADLARYRWKVLKSSGRVYASRTVGRTGRTELMHRAIVGALSGELVDHKDNNTLNNRRGNLRRCSQSQNLANSPARGGSSDYKGVSWNWAHFKWVAQIGGGNLHRFLGYFDSEEEAARAYDRVALQMYGEFATLNFPGE